MQPHWLSLAWQLPDRRPQPWFLVQPQVRLLNHDFEVFVDYYLALFSYDVLRAVNIAEVILLLLLLGLGLAIFLLLLFLILVSQKCSRRRRDVLDKRTRELDHKLKSVESDKAYINPPADRLFPPP
ncbi:hypothetical protein CONLIGDRAFT_685912 [Coniochaeta ligniaria NRRL 30616]|uniref:Uncharacterized protein n=1 Tax=Coniochaeta ligniaria NRRL 30616 TaxID=1408157 RepID=A0A1J7J569_9PEZI|nr:hypothetical protein CONLIGDRAFT_685912 [Coniochaeta ligniaria NRRL 30616]